MEFNVSSQTSLKKNFLVEAGAGAGKTTYLIDRIFKSYQDFRAQEKKLPRMIVCTFTRKATSELKQRLVQKATGLNDLDFLNYLQDSENFFVGTIHGICSHFLKNHSHHLGLSSQFALMSEAKAQKVSQKILRQILFQNEEFLSLLEYLRFSEILSFIKRYRKLQLGHSKPSFISFSEVKDLVSCIKPARGEDLSFVLSNEERLIQISQIFQNLAQSFESVFLDFKKSEALLETDDLELFTLKILENFPYVQKQFSARLDFLFVDEYQDTSLIQEKILDKIASRNFIAVGDPQQSIYSFRGADKSVFEKKRSETQVSFLNTAYRQRPELLDFFNEALLKDFKPMQAKSSKRDPQALVAYFLECQSKEDRFEAAYFQVLKLLKKGEQFEDIFILALDNASIKDFALFLRSKNLPVCLNQSGAFAKQRPVLDLCFFLKFLINPFDDINFVSLLRTPYFNFSDLEIFKLTDEFKKSKSLKVHSLWDFFKTQKSELLEDLNYYINSKEEKTLSQILEEFLIQKSVLERNIFFDGSGLQEASVWKFLHQVKTREKDPNFSFLNFVYEILYQESSLENLDASSDPLPALAANSINLMTVHTAKGLTLKNVIFLGLEKSLSRGASSKELQLDWHPEVRKLCLCIKVDPENSKTTSKLYKAIRDKRTQARYEELKRVFYVAVTRAVNSVSFVFFKDFEKSLKDSQKAFETSSFAAWFLPYVFGPDFKAQEGVYKKETYSYEYKVFNSTKDKLSALESSQSSEEVLDPVCKPQTSVLVESKKSLSGTQTFDNVNLLFNSKLKASFGTFLHKSLEISFSQSLDEATNYIQNLALNQKEKSELLKALDYVLSLDLIKSNLEHLQTELPIDVPFEKHSLSGRIDLLINLEKEVYVIDYKSSSDSKQEDSFLQLGFYALALQEAYPKKVLKLELIYPLLSKKYSRIFDKNFKDKVLQS